MPKTKIPGPTPGESDLLERIAWPPKEVEPRGTWLQELMQEKQNETGSTEFSNEDLLTHLEQNGRYWTDMIGLTRRLIIKEVISPNIDRKPFRIILFKEAQRCLASMRNRGNAVSHLTKKAEIASVPMDWTKPHILEGGYEKARYCSRDEFEKNCIAAMGEDAFKAWKEKYSEIEPKGERSNHSNESAIEVVDVTLTSDSTAEVEIFSLGLQKDLGCIKVQRNGDYFRFNSPAGIKFNDSDQSKIGGRVALKMGHPYRSFSVERESCCVVKIGASAPIEPAQNINPIGAPTIALTNPPASAAPAVQEIPVPPPAQPDSLAGLVVTAVPGAEIQGNAE